MLVLNLDRWLWWETNWNVWSFLANSGKLVKVLQDSVSAWCCICSYDVKWHEPLWYVIPHPFLWLYPQGFCRVCEEIVHIFQVVHHCVIYLHMWNSGTFVTRCCRLQFSEWYSCIFFFRHEYSYVSCLIQKYVGFCYSVLCVTLVLI